MEMNQSDRILPLVFAATVAVFTYELFGSGIPFLLQYDLFGSYIYLPLAFDQHTITVPSVAYLESIQEIRPVSPSWYQFFENSSGKLVTKYPIGWALLHAPFYGIASLHAWLSGVPTNGFSEPYALWIAIGSWTYFVAGLYTVMRIIRAFLRGWESIGAFLVLVFGTNYYFLQTASLGSTHAIEFSLVAVFVFCLIRLNHSVSTRKVLVLFTVLALITLVRPPDLVLGLSIFFVPWAGEHSLRGKWTILRRVPWATYFSASLIFTGIIFLQLLYWKLADGHWFINSYKNNPGEGFDWQTPHTVDFLVSFRKGWFVYTPIAAVALLGLLWSSLRGLLIPIALFIYIASAWSTWWYAGSFGQRAMVDTYPILLLGLIAIFAIRKAWIRIGMLLLSTGAIVLNVAQSYQLKHGILHESNMTKAFYHSVFLQFDPPSDAQRRLLLPDHTALQERHSLPDWDAYKLSNRSWKRTFRDSVSAAHPHTAPIDFFPQRITKQPFVVEITWTMPFQEGWEERLSGKHTTACFFHENQPYAWVAIPFDAKNARLTDEETIEWTTYYYSPAVRSINDVCRVTLWQQAGSSVRVLSANVALHIWKDVSKM